jgi:hypothetical protein
MGEDAGVVQKPLNPWDKPRGEGVQKPFAFRRGSTDAVGGGQRADIIVGNSLHYTASGARRSQMSPRSLIAV